MDMTKLKALEAAIQSNMGLAVVDNTNTTSVEKLLNAAKAIEAYLKGQNDDNKISKSN